MSRVMSENDVKHRFPLQGEEWNGGGLNVMASLRQRLRNRLTKGPVIVAPGIYDAYGARFVEQAGFEAVYMTGNGVSASLLGRPDVGLIDLTLFAAHAHRASAAVEIRSEE